MSKIVCEVCGGELLKTEDVFICQNCGCKYSIEEVRKMMATNGVSSVNIQTTTDNVESAGKHNKHVEDKSKKYKKIIKIVAPIICICIAFIILLTTVIIPSSKYNAAVKLYNDGKYSEAITAFEALDGYKDSESQIDKCNTAIMDNKYNDAIKLYNEGRYSEAITALKELNGYKDSEAQIDKCNTAIMDSKYNAAMEIYNNGDVVEAYEALIELDGYKDSAKKAKSIFDKYKTEKLKVAMVGDYVTFGVYEQDNDASNGKENISWLVLAKDNNKILVISENALDCQKYNSSYANVTWETCSLRSWLNETFLNSAFNTTEQSQIKSTTVTADKNPNYSTSAGYATTDKIFLLSITEVEKYFTTNEERKCVPTAYAKANGAYTSSSYTKDGESTCWWWLRSPGRTQASAAYVDHVGSVHYFGYDVFYVVDDCVRPALWISLDT